MMIKLTAVPSSCYQSASAGNKTKPASVHHLVVNLRASQFSLAKHIGLLENVTAVCSLL